MKKYAFALAVAGVLALGTLGSAEARDRGHPQGVHKQGRPAVQHRAGPRRPAVPAARHHQLKRHLRAHAGKRVWRMRGRHHRAKPWYWKHRRFHRPFHLPHGHVRPVYRGYPVYLEPAGRSLGVEIETEQFRFQVNESG